MPFEFIGPAKLYIGNPVTAAGARMADLGDVEDVAFEPGLRLGFTSSASLSGAPKAGGIHALPPTPVVQAQLKDGALAVLQDIMLGANMRGTASATDAITAVSQANKTFTVATDKTATYTAGKRVAVTGSNIGVYTVISSTYGTSTVITVVESIPTATVDGTIGIATSEALGGGDDFKLVAEADVPTLAIIPYTQKGVGVAAANGIWLPAAIADQINGLTLNRPQAGEIGNAYNVQFAGAYRSADQGSTSIPVGNRMWFMGPPSALGLTWYLP